MMVLKSLKKFVSDCTKNIPQWLYQKGCLMMTLNRFLNDDTKKVV